MNNNDLPKFALNLKRIRAERNLSQQDLADLSNVSRQSIGSYEKGIRRPKIDATKRMAIALNVSPSDIDPFGAYEHPDDPELKHSFNEESSAYMDVYERAAIFLRTKATTDQQKLIIKMLEHFGFVADQ